MNNQRIHFLYQSWLLWLLVICVESQPRQIIFCFFLFPTVCTFKPESNWLQQINFCIFRCLIKTCYCNLKNSRETTKKYKNYVNFMKNKILQASRNCHHLLKITGNFKAQLTATECSHFWVISDVIILHTDGKPFTNRTILKDVISVLHKTTNNISFSSTFNRKERSETYVGKRTLP